MSRCLLLVRRSTLWRTSPPLLARTNSLHLDQDHRTVSTRTTARRRRARLARRRLPDYPAGSLISRLLPTSTTAAASSESGSHESSRGPRSVTIHPSRIHRSVHALPVAAACSDAVTPLLRQHREQAALADRPRQAGLRRSSSVSCPLNSNPLCLAAPSWVHRGTETLVGPRPASMLLSQLSKVPRASVQLCSLAATGPCCRPPHLDLLQGPWPHRLCSPTTSSPGGDLGLAIPPVLMQPVRGSLHVKPVD